jgi:hypothetical protein
MPAALYIQMLLFRAFRPNFTFITNVNGKTVPITSLDILDQLLCRVSHNPVTGAMSFFPAEPVDGNGYAIAKGYQVGADLFKAMKPEQFAVDFFSTTKRAFDVGLWDRGEDHTASQNPGDNAQKFRTIVSLLRP